LSSISKGRVDFMQMSNGNGVEARLGSTTVRTHAGV
jgi:hypothetical protein